MSYNISRLAPRTWAFGAAAMQRFPVEGLPVGEDVIGMKISIFLSANATATTSTTYAVTVANWFALLNQITLRAAGRTLIDRMSLRDLDMKAVMWNHGVGIAGATPGAITAQAAARQYRYDFTYWWRDPRAGENASCDDKCFDSSALMVNGSLDIVPGTPVITNMVGNVTVEVTFMTAPRGHVYIRPILCFRKYDHNATRGIRLDRGVFDSIWLHGNAATPSTGGFVVDLEARISARAAGRAFLDDVAVQEANDIAATQISAGAAIVAGALTTEGYGQDVVVVHRDQEPAGEISKTRRLIESEGRIDLTPGTFAAFTATAVEVVVVELLPITPDWFDFMCARYGVDSSTADVKRLGAARDPYMPIMIL